MGEGGARERGGPLASLGSKLSERAPSAAGSVEIASEEVSSGEAPSNSFIAAHAMHDSSLWAWCSCTPIASMCAPALRLPLSVSGTLPSMICVAATTTAALRIVDLVRPISICTTVIPDNLRIVRPRRKSAGSTQPLGGVHRRTAATDLEVQVRS